MTASPVNGADGFEEFFRRCILQEEPAGAGLDGGQRIFIEVEGCEDDDLDLRALRTPGLRCCLLQDAAGGFNAVHPGHADIHKDHVRGRGAERLKGLDAVACFGDHVEVRLRIDEHAKARTDQLLVIDECDPDGCGEFRHCSGLRIGNESGHTKTAALYGAGRQ